jgi:hypothetical protein
MPRPVIRLSYATALGFVWLALGLLLALDIVLEASDVWQALQGLLIPAVPLVSGLLIVWRQPTGGWLSLVALPLFPLLVLGMLGSIEWSSEPATYSLYGLHEWIITLLSVSGLFTFGALVVGSVQAITSARRGPLQGK